MCVRVEFSEVYTDVCMREQLTMQAGAPVCVRAHVKARSGCQIFFSNVPPYFFETSSLIEPVIHKFG